MLPQMLYNGEEEEAIAANEDLALIENVEVKPETVVKIESDVEEASDVNNGAYNDNAVAMETETMYASSVNRLPEFVCGPVLHADSKYKQLSFVFVTLTFCLLYS